jgi:ABC-2 type transport system ATP-binding protein
LWSEISRLSNAGLTILLTTHYLEEADKLAERLAVVDRGKVVVEGEPEQLKAELHGDAVQIDFDVAPSTEQVEFALRGIEAVTETKVDGKTLHARADHGASAAPLVLAALDAQGLKVASVKVSRPSLDDVYLRYTRRTFQQAEGGRT